MKSTPNLSLISMEQLTENKILLAKAVTARTEALPARAPCQGGVASPRARGLAIFCLLAALFLFTANNVRADEELDLIATLKSNAGVPAKCTACLRLRVIGSANSVPALAALLGDERTSQAARNALEGMPFPEAGAALRESLGKVAGALNQ